MNKYRVFLDTLDQFINYQQCSEDFMEVYEEIKTKAENQDKKPMFTENGLEIFSFFQLHSDKQDFTAKDIAEELDVSSRKVSGAVRKLIDDGLISKKGSNPVVYNLTDKGKKFDLNEYNNKE